MSGIHSKDVSPMRQILRDILPLAPLQEGLLFHALLEKTGPDVYMGQCVVEFEGPIDASRLEGAAQGILDRYANLRASFRHEAGKPPLQVIPQQVRIPWDVLDLSGGSESDVSARVRQWLAIDRARRFDLRSGPLLRAALIQIELARHRLVITFHHLLLDAWSVPIVVRDLLRLYDGDAMTPPITPYRQYLGWLAQQDRAAAKEAWRKALAGIDDGTCVAPPGGDRIGAVQEIVRVSFSTDASQRLTDRAKVNGWTLNTLVQAAWGVVIGQVVGRDDIVFGQTVSGRPPELPNVEQMVGMFINTIPVRLQIRRSERFDTVLNRLQRQSAAVLPYHYLSLTDIHSVAGVSPLFDTLIVFENVPAAPPPAENALRQSDIRTRVLSWYDTAFYAHYPLNLVVIPRAHIELHVGYRADVFTRDVAVALGARLQRLLEFIVHDPSRRIADVDLLTDTERAAVLSHWNQGRRQSMPDTVLSMLARHCAERPDAIAIVEGDTAITCAGLQAAIMRVAARISGHGVGLEQTVAVMLPRSFDWVIAVFATWWAGAAYMPLALDDPPDRLTAMVEHARPALFITNEASDARLPDSSVPVLQIDARHELPAGATARATPIRLDAVAYVMHTSGSSGRPKQVAVTHRGLPALAIAQADQLNISPASRVLQFASVTFDASIWELVGALANGAALVLLPSEARAGRPMSTWMVRHAITHVTLPPSVLETVPETPAALECVVVAGEACSPQTASTWAGRRRFINAYGPTETTVCATMSEPHRGDGAPALGRPIVNSEIFVLDAGLAPAPVGIVGELYVAGTGLARGYVAQPAVTATRFVAHPWGPTGARLYRTGDLVRWHADGSLEFRGRADTQIKIRGIRIDPGEIEAAMCSHSGVDAAVVIVREDVPGDKRLVGYFTGDVAPVAVQQRLATRLPDTLLPTALVRLPGLPLTSSGKIDRRALPPPDCADDRATHRAPRTPIEEILCEQMAAVLGVAEVGLDDDFFELGGHSLSAIQLMSGIHALLGADIGLQTIFDSPTVAGLAREVQQTTGRPPLQAQPRPAVIPLSYAQQRLWFLHRLDPSRATYNAAAAWRLEGSLDVTSLGQAIRDVITRHEALRTTFPEIDGVPCQHLVAADRINLEWARRDETEGDVTTLLVAAAQVPFDLSCDLPIRPSLFRTGPHTHVLLLVLHHIAADGWSLGILERDLSKAYAARCAGAAPGWLPLPVQYADYTLWQRRVLGDETDPASAIAQQLSYWRTTLADLPERLELPTDHPYPAIARDSGDAVAIDVPAHVHAGLVKVAQRVQASSSMVIQAALAGVLTRLGAGDDVPLGTPIAGRTEQAVDSLVGSFVNTLVLRVDTGGNPRLSDLIGRARSTALSAYAHADVPFERVVEAINPARSLGRQPLVQVTSEIRPATRVAPSTLRGVSQVTPEPVGIVTAKFDLSINLAEQRTDDRTPSGIAGRIAFRTDLFRHETVRRIAWRFTCMLAAIAVNPSQRLGAVDLLAESERRQLLLDYSVGPAQPSSGETVLTLIERQARIAPDAIAVAGVDDHVTYRSLLRHADALAVHLRRCGVGTEARVGVMFDVSIDIAVAALAIWKAGATYVPLDPSYPAARLAFMIADAAPSAIVTDRPRNPDWPPNVAIVDRVALDFDAASSVLASNRIHPEQAAYLIYTSGSTGRPKGVLTSHGAMANTLRAAVEIIGLRTGDVMASMASYAFDISLMELVGPWLTGATVRLFSRGAALERNAFDQVDVLHAVPGLMRSVTDDQHRRRGAQRHHQRLLTGGERVPLDLLRGMVTMVGADHVRVFYGPTEATIICASEAEFAARRDDARTTPLGAPIANMRLYALDKMLEAAPSEVAGEIYIGGPGVARGYWRQPAMTASRFVADPYGPPGSRAYRTGDLAKRRPDGHLEYVGRIDDQVKVRGFRIEIAEVEEALRVCAGVRDAAVVARDDAAECRLIAYVTRDDDPSGVATTELRAVLAEVLPEYMVPSMIVELPQLPLSANGKLDRAALPVDVAIPPMGGGRQPRTPSEQVLCDLFAEVLGVPVVRPDDDFFALGGHSLSAIQLVSGIRAVLGVDVAVQTVFEAPTVAALAPQLVARSSRKPLIRQERPAAIPLGYAQQRLWFLHRLAPQLVMYHIPLAWRIEGPVDVNGLDAALRDVVARHESLRTRYADLDGVPRQDIMAVDAAPIRVLVSDTPEGSLATAVSDMAAVPFDLSSELPIRARLFRCGIDVHLLAILVHHIAADGWSMAVLARDLSVAYAARCRGESPRWAPLLVQYADFAMWQRDLLGETHDGNSEIAIQLKYWRTALQEMPEQIHLPLDNARPAFASDVGGSVPIAVSAETHSRLVELARGSRATLSMVVQAAVAALLTRSGAGADIPLGMAIAGRIDPVLDDVVGCFVNTLVLRVDTSGNPTFVDLIARVRSRALAAYAHADVPFERVVEEVNPVRSLARQPLFQVAVDLRQSGKTDVALDGTRVIPEPVALDVAQSELAIVLAENPPDGRRANGLSGRLRFRADLFAPDTIDRLAARLVRVLTAMSVNPGQRLGGVALLDDRERQALLGDARNTPVPVPASTAVALIQSECARRPEAVAIVSGGSHVTYGALADASSRLATSLLNDGVAVEEFVGIRTDRSPAFLIAVLGVWKAAAAYVPIDPSCPPERARLIVRDVGLRCVITDERDRVQELEGIRSISLRLSPERRCAHVRRSCHADQAAYVMYTSGSTGSPKGVVVPHRGLPSLAVAHATSLRVTPAARVFQFAAISFDASVWELVMGLTTGATLVIGDADARTGDALYADMQRHAITHATLPPSILDTLPSAPPSLECIVVAGEACSAVTAARWSSDRTFVNAYGPTETTVCATMSDAVTEGTPAIGGAIPNTNVYVLDEFLAPVRVGDVGELYVSGSGLARGYAGRSGLTAAHFVADPSGRGTRLYRTGDMVRLLPTGALAFVGRADQQVKIRSVRVEIGEVEAVLMSAPGVRAVAVVPREDARGDTTLIAYIVGGVTPRQLRAHLAERVLDAMIPTAFVIVDDLPLTASGKIDRRALPSPAGEPAATFRGPRTADEATLCEMFARVLGRHRVGLDDDFFMCGGHSLLAMQLISRVKTELGIDISIRDLFRTPTVGALVDSTLTGHVAERADPFAELLPIRSGGSKPPVFCIHAGGGLSWCYSGLLRHIAPDWPIYGLQAPGISTPAPLPESVHELAARYVEHMRHVTPHGPYHLVGWSFGGHVAHAMATLLRGYGELVGVVALVDSYPAPETGDDVEAAIVDESSDAPHVLRPILDALGAPESVERSLQAIHRRLVGLHRAFRPPVYDGDTILFVSRGHGERLREAVTKWRPYVRGHINVHPVDAAHEDLFLKPEPIAFIGRVIGAALDRATGAAAPA